MAIEIVDFPIKNGGSFHGKMLVYQRVFLRDLGMLGSSFSAGAMMNVSSMAGKSPN